jgi:guanylate kinase
MASADPGRRGLLIILSSPSGAGKSTLARRLMDWDPRCASRSRPPPARRARARWTASITISERRGVQGAWCAEGAMLEHAHVFGHFYGSPLAPVAEAIEAGRDVLFDIDWQGAQQIRNSALATTCCRSSSCRPRSPSCAAAEGRGQDSAEVIAKRMQKSWDEISHWDGYDYVLVNDDLDATEAAEDHRRRRAACAGAAAGPGPCARCRRVRGGAGMIYALDGRAPRTSPKTPGSRRTPT